MIRQQDILIFLYVLSCRPLIFHEVILISYLVHPGSQIKGEIAVPGDKSISHRAVILSAISDHAVHISNILPSDDVLALILIMESLGVQIFLNEDKKSARVQGVGLYGLKSPKNALDCGNSGTSMRLLTGLLAAQSFDSLLIGDASLMQRPMLRIVEPLRLMGAKIHLSPNYTAPIEIIGHSNLRDIDYTLPIPSAQVKSGILLANLYTQGKTIVREKSVTRDHTEKMLRYFQDGTVENIEIPGDMSSAAFFMVLAAITPHSHLLIKRVGINPYRTGIIKILKLMGADISLQNHDFCGAEPVADIDIQYAPLRGITIPQDKIIHAMDELPVILIAAAMASGETILRGASELRVKESDRIAMMVNGFRALGVCVQEYDDGISIVGKQLFQGGCVNSGGDHRIAMAFSIAAHVATTDVVIEDCACINTSFPYFEMIAKQVGMKLCGQNGL